MQILMKLSNDEELRNFTLKEINLDLNVLKVYDYHMYGVYFANKGVIQIKIGKEKNSVLNLEFVSSTKDDYNSDRRIVEFRIL